MLTEGDIANYIYTKSKGFGIANVWQWGNIPNGEVNAERVTVQVKPMQEDVVWFSGFAEINVLLPNIEHTEYAPLIRMNEVEHIARQLFDKNVEKVEDDWLRYEIDTLNSDWDAQLHCYYINVHLRIEVLNINN